MAVSSLVWCSLSILFMDVLRKLGLKNHKTKLPADSVKGYHWTIPAVLVVFKPRKDRGSFEVIWSIINALIGTQVIASKTQMNASSQGSLAKFSWPDSLGVGYTWCE
ncbi:hypothetical protein ARMGADRAFT_1028438 [Armillaria gallica]|uniref:Uncharacterized protein n=1 Tax=Armillaria gallica TaxID=47427 RepID=A0A2H3DLZ5_ARMGA|nr:hypothetical protein ARMGADRAFT_1028438 [Armillaria gallica]